MKSWRIVADVDAVARALPSGQRNRRHPVHLAVDVQFDALSPAVGTDGQQTGGPRTDQASAAATARPEKATSSRPVGGPGR